MNYAREYHTYLRLERSYSPNTIASYELDLQKMFDYFEAHGIDPIGTQLADLQAFLYDTFRDNSNARTQARLIASVHSYYRFLLYHHGDHRGPLCRRPGKGRLFQAGRYL